MEKAQKGVGVPHYWGTGASDLKGLLADHASLLHTFLDAYEYTGKWAFVARAMELADFSLKTLLDEEGGGFYDIPKSEFEVGELRSRDILAAPSELLLWAPRRVKPSKPSSSNPSNCTRPAETFSILTRPKMRKG